MRILTLFLAVGICTSTVQSQNISEILSNQQTRTDSINSLLDVVYHMVGRSPQKARQFTTYADSLARLDGDSTLIYEIQFKNALATRNLRQHQEALKEFEKYIRFQSKVDNQERLANGYLTAGSLYAREGEFERSEQYLDQANSYFETVKDTFRMARVHRAIGSMYRRQGEYSKALVSYQSAIPLLQAIGERSQLSSTYNSLGILYGNMREKDKAIAAFEKTYELNLASGEKLKAANSLANLGGIYDDDKKSNSAYLKALSLYQELGLDGYSAGVYYNWGLNEQQEDNFQKAIPMYDQAMRLYKKEGAKPNIQLLQNAAFSHAKLGQKSKAKQYIGMAQDRLEDVSDIETKAGSLDMLSQASYLIGDYDKAYRYLFDHTVMRDSLFQTQKLQDYRKLETEYAVKEKNSEIARLELEEELNQQRISRQRNTIIGTVLSLGLLSFLLYRLFGQKREIEKQSNLLSKALGEKDTLLREIHHRVKNNLQVISSLLNLQSREVDDEKALGALSESQLRVRSMSLIHQDLYQQDNLRSVDMKVYLEKLCDNVFSTYQLGDMDLDIRTDFEELEVDIDTAIPIGLITNELISNALKYAFEDRSSGTITVGFQSTEKDEYMLTVADNGVGKSNSSAKNSFGEKLISTFVNQLEGNMTTNTDKGTEVSIVIPM